MAARFSKDQVVRQILPAPIEGAISRFVFDETSGEIIVIVTDSEGRESSFREDQ